MFTDRECAHICTREVPPKGRDGLHLWGHCGAERERELTVSSRAFQEDAEGGMSVRSTPGAINCHKTARRIKHETTLLDIMCMCVHQSGVSRCHSGPSTDFDAAHSTGVHTTGSEPQLLHTRSPSDSTFGVSQQLRVRLEEEQTKIELGLDCETSPQLEHSRDPTLSWPSAGGFKTGAYSSDPGRCLDMLGIRTMKRASGATQPAHW